MSNRRLTRVFPVLFLVVLAVVSVSAQSRATSRPAQHPAARPNVVLITIDTLRPDHLHCYGYDKIQTPNIDSIAADGVRFEGAFTPIPITLPSHSVILTGTYPMMSGMHDFSGNNLSPEQPTLATVLRARGYDTGAVIAAAVLDRRFGLNRGFDFYYDHFDFSRLAETNLDLMERPANQVIDQALAWLTRPRRRPFFLWVHLYDPHHPYKPPAPFDEQYKSNLYDGEIAFTDTQLGRLLLYLKEHGLYNQTLLVVSGDHGEGLGEHGEKTHGFFIYNSTLHVPLIIKLPQWEKAARKVQSDQVSLVDLMPTMLGLLTAPVPPEVQGKNLAEKLLHGGELNGSPLYSETYLPRIHFNWSELRGLAVPGYHFIDGPKPELYDLSHDPHELRNLYTEKQAVSGELLSQLTSIVRQYTSEHQLAQKTSLDPELARRLQSLGYAALAAGDSSPVSDPKLPDPKDRIQVYETVTEAIDDSQHGRFQESIEKLKTTLTTEENSVPIHYLLGLNYYRSGNFTDAAAEFKKALAISPNYMLATFNLGLAYAALGNDDDSIPYLKRTLELDPTNFSAAFDLGVAYLHKERIPESTEAFRQAVTIYPDFAPGYKALGEMLVYQGKIDAGLKELRTAVRLAPGDPRNHQALAKALQAKGLNAEAAVEMRKAQEQRP
ncbi:MAG TPA: sulfatase-like hydrolase/transferase [Terriglobales bacterium]|jgi:arylsulfatase A-like enzyme/Flp pilus assembly protein TadD